MTTKKKATKRAKKGRKRTGDRVSRIAARVMRVLDGEAPLDSVYTLRDRAVCSVADLKALAASCLSQDEQRGRRR